MSRAIRNYIDRERPFPHGDDVNNYNDNPAINWSKLKLLDTEADGCPADLRDALDNPIDTDTHSRRGLRLDHTLVLEPHNFDRDYFIGQAHPASIESVQKKIDGDGPMDLLACVVSKMLSLWSPEFAIYNERKGTNAYKAFAAANPKALIVKQRDLDEAGLKASAIAHDIRQSTAGKTRITQKQYDEAQAKAHAVRTHPVAGPIVTNPDNEYEGVIRYVDPETGEECKGRADIQDPAAKMTWDFKSSRSAHPRELEREIGRMRYHGQGAHYTKHNGYGFGIIAVAKCRNSAGYRVTVMELGPVWLEAGMALRDRLMATYAECKKANHWPDHCDGARIVAENPSGRVLDAADGFDDTFTTSKEN